MRRRILATIGAVATLSVVAFFVPTALSVRNAVVRVSDPTAGDRRVRDDLIPLGLAALAVIVTAIVVGALLARRLSRPVEQLGQWARTFGRDMSSRPAPPPSGIAELDELRDSLQQADERIRDLLRRERSFSSHVAHQLRTPVAAMRVAVEAELESPRPDATALLHESLGALDRLESTITSLLALSRHDHGEPVTCDVADVVRAHAERWRSMLATHDRPLDVRGTGVVARIDPAAVRHILDVLLDNALRHGRGRVTVTTGCTDGHVEIDVADEGRAAGQRDPFSEHRGASSHGIGLRLARTLAETQGGRLTLLERPTTVFRLTVPVERRPLNDANRT